MAKFINIRLDDEEFDALNNRASQAGMTVHNYILGIAKLKERPLGDEYLPPTPNPMNAEKPNEERDVQAKPRTRKGDSRRSG